MIVKIDAETEALLTSLEKLVTEQTGLKPQSKSMMAQAVLKWAITRIKGSRLHQLAPQMLNIVQQRKAVIADLIAKQEQMDSAQLQRMMSAIGKITQSGDKNGTPSVKKTTQV